MWHAVGHSFFPPFPPFSPLSRNDKRLGTPPFVPPPLYAWRGEETEEVRSLSPPPPPFFPPFTFRCGNRTGEKKGLTLPLLYVSGIGTVRPPFLPLFTGVQRFFPPSSRGAGRGEVISSHSLFSPLFHLPIGAMGGRLWSLIFPSPAGRQYYRPPPSPSPFPLSSGLLSSQRCSRRGFSSLSCTCRAT